MFLMKEKIHSAGGLGNLKKLLSENKDELAVLIGQCKGEIMTSSLYTELTHLYILLFSVCHSLHLPQFAIPSFPTLTPKHVHLDIFNNKKCRLTRVFLLFFR